MKKTRKLIMLIIVESLAISLGALISLNVDLSSLAEMEETIVLLALIINGLSIVVVGISDSKGIATIAIDTFIISLMEEKHFIEDYSDYYGIILKWSAFLLVISLFMYYGHQKEDVEE